MEQWVRDLLTNPIYLVLIGPLSVWLGKIWATRISGREAHKQQLALNTLQSDLKLETQQREHALAQEREQWRAELGKHAFVHQVQFETEFNVYRDVWKSLVELKRATLALRPVLDTVDLNEPEDVRKRKRYGRFVDAYNAFIDAVDLQRPFLLPSTSDDGHPVTAFDGHRGVTDGRHAVMPIAA